MSNRLSPQLQISPETTLLTEAEIGEIADRLEKNAYPTLFGCLEDWHKLKAAAFHTPHLVAPYAHLLEMEIDED